jgi:hypothetical protein
MLGILALLMPFRYYEVAKQDEVVILVYDHPVGHTSLIHAPQGLKLPFDGVLLVGY